MKKIILIALLSTPVFAQNTWDIHKVEPKTTTNVRQVGNTTYIRQGTQTTTIQKIGNTTRVRGNAPVKVCTQTVNGIVCQ